MVRYAASVLEPLSSVAQRVLQLPSAPSHSSRSRVTAEGTALLERPASQQRALISSCRHYSAASNWYGLGTWDDSRCEAASMSARWRTASAPRPKAGMHPGRWRRESVQPVVPRTLAQSTDDVVPLQACAPSAPLRTGRRRRDGPRSRSHPRRSHRWAKPAGSQAPIAFDHRLEDPRARAANAA